ncbi:T9SS type A sorting domain-containing protein [Flavobacterium sediminilitoris]|uniref:T9SS type A sorting domain-containing protein n=1 Tax=Flavobacterium sediminilitoris TaxID=2024526 RepID=A0ABY4HQM2_9FLAO|nr:MULTISPECIES: T9SS type A sorting domain-containing protein [Flavobacterium]UOX34069.1 T9SS type A sorting domain-containing protein [Flavobacterium sediminilitoris]
MKKIILLLLFITGTLYAQPPINTPSNYVVCESGNSNFGLFDLTSKNAEILGSLNPNLYTVTYYEYSNDAQNGVNPIQNPNQFIANNVYDSITIRVHENANPSNFAITYLQLITNYGPTISQSPNMTVFEDPNDNVAIFDLTQQIPRLVGNQTNLNVTFYLSELDAIANTNELIGVTSYTNISNPQAIYARVENINTGCYEIADFELIVSLEGIVNIPDANLKAKLLAADENNSIASNVNPNNSTTWNIYTKIDTNEDGEIQFSEAAAIIHLNVSGSSPTNGGIQNLQGLESFYNLSYFNCGYNQLTTIDLSVLPNLKYFHSTNNDITSLGLTNCNTLEVLNCDYNQLANIDVSQCPNLTNLNVRNNELTSLNLDNNHQITSISAFNNNLTNFELQNKNFVRTLHIGFNQLTSLQLTNLPILYRVQAQNNDLSSVDFSTIAFQTEPNNLPAANLLDISVNNNVNLTFINLKNGFTNPEVDLSSGNLNNTLQFICMDEDDVVGYFFTTPNPVINTYCSFTPGGDYNTITGLVQFDDDNDGCDNSDSFVPYLGFEVNIDAVTTNSYVYSNTIGNYSLFTNQTGTYSLIPNFENPSIYTITPISAEVPFPVIDNSVVTQNFCVSANGVHPDLEIVIAPIVPARPGFEAVYKIVYKNKGNQTLSQLYGINFFYNHNLMNFVSTSIPTSTVGLGSLSWDYADLKPFESRSIYVTFNINSPTDPNPVNIDDVLQLTASIMPQSGDINTMDNLFQFNQTVVGSFDPNDISCIEGEIVSPTMIGEYLHYIINFENTGNYQAENIVVKIEVNPEDFDIKTLQLLNASHNLDVRIKDNIIELIFQAIYLDTGGHGNILLKIKTKDNLVTTDIVTNKAAIYFDYNAPIETNLANTTFETLSSAIVTMDSSIQIYPNPSNSIVNIKSNTTIESIEVYDINGRLIVVKMLDDQITTMNISDFETGIYILKIKSEKGEKVEKLIKD